MNRSFLYYGRGQIWTVVILIAALPGCGSRHQVHQETFIRPGISRGESAPTWVRGRLPQTQGQVSFVGLGVAHNVLDERAAFDMARRHALQQLSEYVLSRIEGSATHSDSVRGALHLPGASGRQQSTASIDVSSQVLLSEARVEEVYWEQWDVREEPERAFFPEFERTTRYKCWVLVTAPRDALMRMTVKAHELERDRNDLAMLPARRISVVPE